MGSCLTVANTFKRVKRDFPPKRAFEAEGRKCVHAIDVPEIAQKEFSEIGSGLRACGESRAHNAERCQLTDEIRLFDVKNSHGYDACRSVVLRFDMPFEQLRIQSRCVRPDPGEFHSRAARANGLETKQRQLAPAPILKVKTIKHAPLPRRGIDEKAERAVLDEELPSQTVALNVSVRAGRMRRIGQERSDVGSGNR